ncbi:MAG TPA: hypothetical protein VE309_01585 [Caulobacteraceae bacterium]|jgi:hypothetical protein|nr:hypothetical protein [Caulobacteraceae bacterium]
MKHATTQALDRIEDLLQELRRLPDLRERSRGVFYRAGKAFLHFHEDPKGLFADVRGADEWERFCVDGHNQQALFLKRTSALLNPLE